MDTDTAVAPRPCGLVDLTGRPFPLTAVHLSARAEAGQAQTVLVQEYANPYPETLEVRYVLPLPADGAVVGYTVQAGDRTITGEIEVRERADARYRRALAEGRTSALLEQDRDDTFSQRLGNLAPGEAVRVEVRVLHPLAFLRARGDEPAAWEYRFPTVVGVRYRGAPGRVPDADRLDAPRADGHGTPVTLRAELAIGDPLPAGEAPSSPSHGIGWRDGTVTLDPEILNRDVVVRWPAAGAEVGVRLAEGSGLPGDGGRYALLTVVPPGGTPECLPRDLTILLDASGSMAGPPIEQAKAVLGALLDGLTPDDRFELLSFSNDVRRLTEPDVPGTPGQVRLAKRVLRDVEASGGTEMVEALEAALAPRRAQAQRQVVLVTDGDIAFEADVIARITAATATRLHAVGVGEAVNRALLAAAARAGRGHEVIVGLGDGPGDGAARLRAATEQPVLTDLAVSGTAVAGIAPAAPRDVLAGAPGRIALELAPGGGTVEVSGRLAGREAPWTATLSVPPAGSAEGSLPFGALYGRERVADLELERAGSGEGRAVDAAIEACGLRHRIVTRRTSFVAVAAVPTADPDAPLRRERLAVELPAGVSAEGVGLASGSVVFRKVALMDFSGDAMSMGEARETTPLSYTMSHQVLWRREAQELRPPREDVWADVAWTATVEGDVLVLRWKGTLSEGLRPRAGQRVRIVFDGRSPVETRVVDSGGTLLALRPDETPADLPLPVRLEWEEGGTLRRLDRRG